MLIRSMFTLLYFTILTCLLSQVVVSFVEKDFDHKLGFPVDWSCAKNKLSQQDYFKLTTELTSCEYDTKVQVEEMSRITAVDEYVHSFCTNFYAKVCASVAIHMLSPCLTNAQRNHLSYSATSYLAEKHFLCKENGKSFKDYVKDSGRACAEKKTDKLNKCHRKYPIAIDIESRYSEKNCRNMKRNIFCRADIANSCKAIGLYTYLMRGNDARLMVTPCGSLYINGGNSLLNNLMRYLIAMLVFCTFAHNFQF